jgi:hypothetical protein
MTLSAAMFCPHAIMRPCACQTRHKLHASLAASVADEGVLFSSAHSLLLWWRVAGEGVWKELLALGYYTSICSLSVTLFSSTHNELLYDRLTGRLLDNRKLRSIPRKSKTRAIMVCLLTVSNACSSARHATRDLVSLFSNRGEQTTSFTI